MRCPELRVVEVRHRDVHVLTVATRLRAILLYTAPDETGPLRIAAMQQWFCSGTQETELLEEARSLIRSLKSSVSFHDLSFTSGR